MGLLPFEPQPCVVLAEIGRSGRLQIEHQEYGTCGVHGVEAPVEVAFVVEVPASGDDVLNRTAEIVLLWGFDFFVCAGSDGDGDGCIFPLIRSLFRGVSPSCSAAMH